MMQDERQSESMRFNAPPEITFTMFCSDSIEHDGSTINAPSVGHRIHPKDKRVQME
jgi:hypothetical protein